MSSNEPDALWEQSLSEPPFGRSSQRKRQDEAFENRVTELMREGGFTQDLSAARNVPGWFAPRVTARFSRAWLAWFAPRRWTGPLVVVGCIPLFWPLLLVWVAFTVAQVAALVAVVAVTWAAQLAWLPVVALGHQKNS